MGRLIDASTGVVLRERRPPTSQTHPASSPEDLGRAIIKLSDRLTAVESSLPGQWVEFDIICPTNGTILLNHGFTGAVRWYVTSWKRKGTAGPWALTELESGGSRTGLLALYSQVPGRAVIRIETAPGGQAPDQTARTLIVPGGTTPTLESLLAPGTSGNVMTSNGSSWTSAALPSTTPDYTNRLTALDANHIHAWELTETNGSTFADTGSSAQKVNLTIQNTSNVQLGLPGLLGPCPFWSMTTTPSQAATDARAAVSSFNDLPTSACTIECWVAPSTSELVAVTYFFSCDFSGSANFQFGINRTGGGDNMLATVRATSFINPTSVSALFKPSAAQNQWTHYAITYDGSFVRMYANAEMCSKTAETGNINWANGSSPQIVIANSVGTGTNVIGRMSRVRISNIARSQSYLRDVYKKAMLF